MSLLKPFITFDRPKLLKLKKLYNKAIKEGKESFFLEEQELLVGYAKYLIEYLEYQLTNH